MKIAYRNGTIFTGQEMLTGKALLTIDQHIEGLVAASEIPSDYTIYDLQGALLAPGLLDLQIYGGGGYLFSADPSAAALQAMTNALISSGTTGFLLTIATNSPEIFRKAVKVVQENPHPAVMGIHFEGPYISPLKRGAHVPEYIRQPDYDEIKAVLEEARGVIKMVTLAPEITNKSIIELYRSYGVVLSAGHSNATFTEAMNGFDAGIEAATHLFNAMSPFHHRDTGLPGAIMEHQQVYSSIIPDGVHVDFHALTIAKKVMGERLFLITDAVEACTTGPYQHVKGATNFTLPDGTLSGSSISLLEGVRNCVRVGISVTEALRMASVYPARLMKETHRGQFTPGARADMLLLNPNTLELIQTINVSETL